MRLALLFLSIGIMTLAFSSCSLGPTLSECHEKHQKCVDKGINKDECEIHHMICLDKVEQ